MRRPNMEKQLASPLLQRSHRIMMFLAQTVVHHSRVWKLLTLLLLRSESELTSFQLDFQFRKDLLCRYSYFFATLNLRPAFRQHRF
ncbi:MAG: hypothetical protein JWQ02_3811 [Capsulimonas sp.]|nr:hypothetical protein [Capsulimonas sp.]